MTDSSTLKSVPASIMLHTFCSNTRTDLDTWTYWLNRNHSVPSLPTVDVVSGRIGWIWSRTKLGNDCCSILAQLNLPLLCQHHTTVALTHLPLFRWQCDCQSHSTLRLPTCYERLLVLSNPCWTLPVGCSLVHRGRVESTINLYLSGPLFPWRS